MEVSVTYFCNKVFDFYLCLTLWVKLLGASNLVANRLATTVQKLLFLHYLSRLSQGLWMDSLLKHFVSFG